MRARGGGALAAVGVVTVLSGLVALAALTLGGTEGAGSLYAAERQTALGATALGCVLAGLLVALALASEVPGPARSLALAVASVPLAVPAVWAAAHEPLPAVADSFGCGSWSNPTGPTQDRRVDDACDQARDRQRGIAGVLALLPAAALLGAAGTVVAERGRR